MNKLRWGILGAARIAEAYATAINASRNGLVRAVASRDPDRAHAFATRNDIAEVFATYQELLDSPSVDAIYLALPNALHAEWTLRALRAGKHVLCEKPLACSATEAATMADAARDAGLVLVEALMYRKHPLNIRAMDYVHSGVLGTLRSVHATFCTSVTESDPIRYRPDLGGGALLDLGVYCVSLLRWATSQEPTSVHAVSQWHAQGVDECTTGLLTFPGGVVGTFTCAYQAPFACRYEVIGTKGKIVCDDGPLCAWPSEKFTIQLSPTHGQPERICIPPADHYLLQAEEFADCVLQGAVPRWDINESCANLAVLDAIRVATQAQRTL